jgi:hypothetical protein
MDGTDGDHHVNFPHTPSFNRITTAETSIAAPAIAVGFGNPGGGVQEQAYIAWTGRDGDHSVNVMSFFPDGDDF